MKKMLVILALCVSACGSIENSKNEPVLNVDSTTNIQVHDSTSSAAQETDSIKQGK